MTQYPKALTSVVLHAFCGKDATGKHSSGRDRLSCIPALHAILRFTASGTSRTYQLTQRQQDCPVPSCCAASRELATFH